MPYSESATVLWPWISSTLCCLIKTKDNQKATQRKAKQKRNLDEAFTHHTRPWITGVRQDQ
jgi:hypothetical protein